MRPCWLQWRASIVVRVRREAQAAVGAKVAVGLLCSGVLLGCRIELSNCLPNGALVSGEPASLEELWALQRHLGCCEHRDTVVPGLPEGWMKRRKVYRDAWVAREATLAALEARRVAACPDDPWMGGRTGTLTDRRGLADAAYE